MKVISLWRPWSQWVALGIKTIESRSHDRFKCLIGQRIVIHSAMKWDAKWIDIIREPMPKDGLPLFRSGSPLWLPGHLICTVQVQWGEWVRSRTLEKYSIGSLVKESALAGKYCLGLSDRKLITPIPWKGRQGIFDVPDEIIKAVSE